MISLKRLLTASAAALAAFGVVFFMYDKRLAAGLAAGLATGVINITVIVFTVKGLITPESKPARAKLTVLVYCLKMLLIGGVIALVIILRKYFSIKGLLIGLALALVLLTMEYLTATSKTKTEKV